MGYVKKKRILNKNSDVIHDQASADVNSGKSDNDNSTLI